MKPEVAAIIPTVNDDIKIVSGGYDLETADQGPFFWLGESVEIEVISSGGLMTLGGWSPLGGKVKITTPQVSFDVGLNREEDTELVIPIGPADGKQRVLIEFQQSLDIESDSRSLSFKAYCLSWQELQSPREKEVSATPLFESRGLLSGQVATVFSAGWLRMSVQRLDDDKLRISGILVTPSWRKEVAVLTANGEPLQEVEYGLFNPDYAFVGNVAFEGTVNLKLYADTDHIRFGSQYPMDGSIATPWYQDWFYPIRNSSLPLPKGENMRRIGSSEADWFLFSGASFVGKLADIFHQFSGSDSLKEISVLDWGCGCGRLTRQLIDEDYGDVAGIDIDPVNIEWCTANLPGASFSLVGPDLPTELLAENFDLIIGHSVFTHLTELDQFMWLAEINRLLKPGGLALVTVMANYSTAIEPFSPVGYTSLMNDGFLDVGWQEDGVDSQKPGFYRRIFHTSDYINKHWTNSLEVVSIQDGYSDHQTAVVLRKRKK
ncbi:class I SAM-dependent methyltransferase [Amphritea sp. HPY]|uniref:class I SAM-dependent methyltransferase n=1 Tax=Amphritea sp. HPY TaxID=3421652 RepID=UPI003D7CC219